MGFSYRDFLGLSWKRFWRSPNLTKNITSKIFSFIGFFFLFLEVVLLGAFAYFLTKETFPESDYFLKFNEYIYLFLVIGFSFILMVNSFKPSAIKPFLLLPVSRNRLIIYHLIKETFSISLFLLGLWVLLAAGSFYKHGYPLGGLLLWTVALWITLMIFSLIAWMNERSVILNFIFSLVIFGSILTIKTAPHWFKPVSDFYADIYHGDIFKLLILLGLYIFLFLAVIRYMRRRFYLDGKFKAKKQEKIADVKLGFTERMGLTGAFIQNDIRMILRNTRSKTILYSSLFYILFAAFVYYAPLYRDNRFMYLFIAFTVTAVFLINYGSYVPAWDSEYYKLLMSQSIRYREYLEAKWWLMVLSVWVMLVLSLPLLYFGTEIFKIIVAFAFFNAGVNVYFVLVTGLMNTRPIKLNEKVQAFSGGQSFNGKLFLLSMLRLALPFAYYYFLKMFFDLDTVLIIVAITGLIGMLLKDKVLDILAQWYNKRKYLMIEKFSKMEEA